MKKQEAYKTFRCWHCVYLDNDEGICPCGNLDSNDCPKDETEEQKGKVNRMNEICDKCLTCHWYCDDVLEECKGQEEPCHEYSPCMEIRRVGEPNE